MSKMVSCSVILLFLGIALYSSYTVSVYAGFGLCPASEVCLNCRYTADFEDCNCPRKGYECHSNGGFVVMAEYGLSINSVTSRSFWEKYKSKPTLANAMIHWDTDNSSHAMVIQQLAYKPGFIKVFECTNPEEECVSYIRPLSYYPTELYNFARF